MDMQNNAKNDTNTLPFIAEGLLQLAGLQSIPCFRSLKAASMEFLERYSSNTFEGENGRLLMSVKSPSLPVTMFFTAKSIAESLSIPFNEKKICLFLPRYPVRSMHMIPSSTMFHSDRWFFT